MNQDDLFTEPKPRRIRPMRPDTNVGKKWKEREDGHQKEIEAGSGKFVHWALIHLNKKKPLPKRPGFNVEWPHWPGLKWKS